VGARFLRAAILMAAAIALLAPAGSEAQRGQGPPSQAQQQVPADDPRLARLKTEAAAEVEKMAKLTQEMVDMVFSFGELGYHEVESSKYLVRILREHGFTVTEGVAGMPTAWLATWGSGKPVISLGSDIDGIPQASQKPGVAYHDPLVPGAPGHGEGHNSGLPLNITAAIAVKRIMERDRIPGTIRIWPGVAEELVGAKAYFVRDGMFRDVDAALFTHVSSNLGTSWGQSGGNALISAEFYFEGQAAHSAGSPWRGRSALDAVELMNIGWNFRREHLRYQQRSHYVIRDGGDQPNVVPATASVWYYFRETDAPRTQELLQTGIEIAEGAAMMTGTKLANYRILGSAWPQHFNRPIAEAMTANATQVGMPEWSEADQQLARAVQELMGSRPTGLSSAVPRLGEPAVEANRVGGGSDDIGDVTWNVPTVTLRFPSNIPGLPGHHWSSSIAMATPIAHKGATAGAKVMALTMLDLMMKPELVRNAWSYFNDVQTRDIKYFPLMRDVDTPALELNRDIMERYRPEMSKFYYDPTRYSTYLEQLGITYPTIRK
jgi:aminobenzoyl-glutamate utilization protein B